MKIKNQNLIQKPPVVVILGHVDSGKTSILDYIRKTRVAERETGGITQHIGAYQVEYQNKKITFIDTPGHEAFSAMRARGAKVADIAVLVIDTTQGIQAQTREAISQAKLAGLPMIVALNKIDLQGIPLTKIKGELQKEGVLVEDFGGQVPAIETSAITGQGIEELLETILLVGEIEELKADLSKPGQGIVIESFLDRKRGPTVSLIIEDGILREGDILATPSALGKVKRMEDFQGFPIQEAFPSMPVLMIGFEECPKVGEKFQTFPDLEAAKKYLKEEKERPKEVISVESGQKVFNLILKADCLGSLEAIETLLKNLPKEKIILRILESEVGDINENDLKLAQSGEALILGFRVKIDQVVKKIAEREKIKILIFELIYDLVEGVRKLMEKVLEPETIRKEIGKVKTLVTFWAEKNRQIVGGKVIEGEVKKGTLIEIFREEEMIGKGRLINLQINKKDVERATKGQECGILYEGEGKIAPGDILEFYLLERKKSEL